MTPPGASPAGIPTAAGDASVAGAHARPAPAPGALPPDPHALDARRLVELLGTDATNGLSADEARDRRERWGPNRLPDPPRKSDLVRLVEQFLNPLVLTLLAAAAIAVVVGLGSRQGGSFLSRFGDAIAILLIVVLNAILGFYQERRAEAAIDALRKMAAPNARVRRDGAVTVVPAAELVPGDLVELEAGDSVPADARLVRAIDLATEEASLTGESAPIQKDARQPVAADMPLAERVTMTFLGTTVVRGKAAAVVVATGPATELGKIGEAISRAGDEATPLERRLAKFGKRVLWACLGISVALFAWGLVRGGRAWHELLLEAVSFAVAAIPEGLPAITTITLALGMQRMARRGAIVRKLPAVETLGSATVICTDKTGTLTQNEMTVREVFAGGERFRVTGLGYAPEGRILRDDGEPLTELSEPLAQLLATATLCNNAHLERDAETGRWRVVGDPTEGALLTLAEKGGRSRDALVSSHRVVRELPFDSDRKRMTVVTLDGSGNEVAHVKGSADVLLPLCVRCRAPDGGARPMSDADRAAVQAEADRMSDSALRVLAMARRTRPSPDNPEEELTFLGLVGMMDPPREGVRDAVAVCHEAGIRAVMITGDHKITATAVAREIGLWTDGDEALTGADLARMDDVELRRHVGHVRVFARTTAEQKLRIVRALKAEGHVVAMTGDGVNDAPALQESHIGVAMGRGGTDVARQAADIVITDDNFATIVEAVREGRAIFRNIQKFIFFLLSSNAGLAVAVFTVSFAGGTWLPLTPLQILWINLVTNGLPALALGVDPPDRRQMRERPRPAGEGLLGTREFIGVAFVGAVMGVLAVSLYAWHPHSHPSHPEFVRALAFSLLALSPLFHAWSCRSPTASIAAQRPLWSTPLVVACALSAAIHLVAVLVPALRPVFRTFPLVDTDWLLLIALSAAVVPAVEAGKALLRSRARLVGAAGAGAIAMLLAAGTARAEGTGVRLELMKGSDVKLDGVPREWPVTMQSLSRTIVGGGGTSARMTVGYDDAALYVAGDVSDDRLHRTAACGPGEDHAALLVAFPSEAGAWTAHEVELYPGDPGKTAGCVKTKGGGPVAGARIVEAPRPKAAGFTFEAIVPWAAFPEAARVRVGLRGALRYYDFDRAGASPTVVATASESAPGEMPRLSIEPEQALEEGLIREKGIHAPPTFDRVADVAGDGLVERIVLYERYLAVLGPHFRGGKEYYFRDLGVEATAGVASIEARDWSGDGKAEIALVVRIGLPSQHREVLEVLSWGSGSEAPYAAFRHEVGVVTPTGTVRNQVRWVPEGRAHAVEVSVGEAKGYTAATYREPVETTMDAVLLPWGAIRSQTYRWQGSSWVKASEEKQTPQAAGVGANGRTEAAAPRPPEPPAPRPPTPDELQDQVYALYRRERKVGAERPRFDFVTNVAGDDRPERVILHGRDLVVFGKGYRGGAGYSFVALQNFADSRDIVDVTARDLTGDGRAEVIVRGVVRAPPPKEAGEKPGTMVDREVLFVYAVGDPSIARAFAVETARALGDRRVHGTIAFLPGARGTDIEVRPGRAVGWTEKTYPFEQDRSPIGGIEPLLVPWSGMGPLRYRWDGTAFVR